MRQQQEINNIIELITKWAVQIYLNNSIYQYDINKLSESFTAKFLNEIYGYELIDLNIENPNQRGIDLGDRTKAKIAFQVSSNINQTKIKQSLEVFVKEEYYTIYTNGIRFFSLSMEDIKSGRTNYKAIYNNFDKHEHIINLKDLITEIKVIYNTDVERFNRIKELLINEFTDYNVKVNERRTLKRKFLSNLTKNKGIHFLKMILWGLVIILPKVLYPDFSLIKSNSVSFLGLALVFLTIYILLKISDNDFNKLLKQHYPITESYKSRSKVPIEVRIFKDNIKMEQIISILNNKYEKIKNITGKAFFYCGNKRVNVINFKEDDIYPTKEVIINKSCYIDDSDRFNWDEFSVFIDKITYETSVLKEVEVIGDRIIRTYFLILNKFNYWRICNFVIPFEVSWLNEEWTMLVLPWIKNYPNLPRAFGKADRKYKIIRFFKRIIWLVVLFVLAMLILLSLKAFVLIIFGWGVAWIKIFMLIAQRFIFK
jgi:hypothetical protein